MVLRISASARRARSAQARREAWVGATPRHLRVQVAYQDFDEPTGAKADVRVSRPPPTWGKAGAARPEGKAGWPWSRLRLYQIHRRLPSSRL